MTQRGRRTFVKILEAAQVVFEEKGYVEARMADVATAAGVSHGTVYTYFSSKEALFTSLVQAKVSEMLGRGQAHDRDWTPLRRIEQANREYLETFQKNAHLLLMWEQVSWVVPELRDLLAEGRRPFEQRTRRTIEHLQETGNVPTSLDPACLAVALVGMMNSFALGWFRKGHSVALDDAVGHLTYIWASALGLDAAES